MGSPFLFLVVDLGWPIVLIFTSSGRQGLQNYHIWLQHSSLMHLCNQSQQHLHTRRLAEGWVQSSKSLHACLIRPNIIIQLGT